LETNKNGDDYFNYLFSNNTPLDMEADESLLEMAADTYSAATDTPLLQTTESPQLVDSSTAETPY
jgi:hypothetical protein